MKDDHTENCFLDTMETKVSLMPQVIKHDEKAGIKMIEKFNIKFVERIAQAKD